ncbi:hypothetical protein B1987_12940 [Mycobacterium kansasii]|uniref:Nitroreductase domain-containing protein n=1 Tax=Mycobacterium attenuatum TaxID=2341086 RepID=A0A498QBJ2_9MYCO|nr:nitroreductase family protein [Mycobacterium attenuatum]ORB84548.1 hypothetical protein B1987_12940 [Mycobacterium kansasii]VBA43658.1 hypothetical protein LAUMK136_05213 [Mycobacterium attenuatum]VBA59805.1 hypothetical protein LAUMK191_05188 [Mycobacterium attenuatum]VBA61969.1 hypothetical protein LAUMK41_05354 [Mycobacterium attenuatum]
MSIEPAKYVRDWRLGDWTIDSAARAGGYAVGLGPSRFDYQPRDGRGLTIPPPGTASALGSVRSFAPLGLDDTRLAALATPISRGPSGMGYGSAGGLYPVHTYLIRPARGRAEIWYAHTDRLRLLLIDVVDAEAVTNVLIEKWAWPCGTLAVLVLDFRRVTDKYGHRGLRFATIEAGELAQMLREKARELSLHSCVVGGYADAAVVDLLGLPPDWYGAALTIAIGERDQACPPQDAGDA